MQNSGKEWGVGAVAGFVVLPGEVGGSLEAHPEGGGFLFFLLSVNTPEKFSFISFLWGLELFPR